jgi:hypothetical protein
MLGMMYSGTKLESNSRNSVWTIPRKRKMLGMMYSGTKLESNSRNSVWTIPRKRKMLGILYHGTKIEANSRNSGPNHSSEEKTPRNSVTWNKNRSKLSEFRSEPFLGREKTPRNSVTWNKNRSKLSEFCSEAFDKAFYESHCTIFTSAYTVSCGQIDTSKRTLDLGNETLQVEAGARNHPPV